MSIPQDLIASNPCLGEWNELLCWRGSIAHGMYVPNTDPDSIDDKDVMGLCVPPADHYFGLKSFGSKGTREIKHGEWDIVVYEFRKGIRMLRQGNPNVLSMLWLPENGYIHLTDVGRELIERRYLFTGKHVYHSFVGYAHGQLHRMTHTAGQGYMGAKRKALVAKFGYDTKNAAHLVRLLRMGIEFLTDGQLRVLREDAQELLAIKRGEWPIERVLAEADRLFEIAREAHVRSPLPAQVDNDKIDALCVDLLSKTLVWRTP